MRALYYPLIFIFGLCLGSFLNVVIFRLRHGGQIWRGRSKCPRCQRVLKWFELIPLASFIIQRGRCRACRKKISWQYPAVEIAAAILFLAFSIQYPVFSFLAFLLYCFIVSVLLVIFVYDLKYGEIPDIITLPAIAIVILVRLFFDNESMGQWGNLATGFLVGAGFFLFQYLISKGRWIGGGDIRLGALMGAILGWPNILFALFIAYILGAVVSIVLILLKKKKLADQTPFGTYLTAATFVAMLWGEGIVRWYLSILS